MAKGAVGAVRTSVTLLVQDMGSALSIIGAGISLNKTARRQIHLAQQETPEPDFKDVGHRSRFESHRPTGQGRAQLREIKSVSSVGVHEDVGVSPFGWQEGYGAFTVSASQLENVRAYIQQQEEHHRTRTFREEYLALLQRSGVEFDKRYL
jgi:hypothetical protein